MKKIFIWILCLFSTALVFGQTAHRDNLTIESTLSRPVWFFIQNGSHGGILELNETGTAVTSKAAPLTSNNDRQLWRFEKDSNGKFVIYNKGRAGRFSNTATWVESGGTEVFTIPVTSFSQATGFNIKPANNQYFTASSATATLSATASDAAVNVWRFIKAPTSSDATIPVWYQWKSLRVSNSNPTYNVLNASSPYAVSWVNTSAPAIDVQLWRFEATTNGYKIASKSRSGEYLYMSGTVGNPSNVTSSSSKSSTFVISPRTISDGSLLVYIHSTSYHAFDYNSSPVSCGLYQRNENYNDNMHFTIPDRFESLGIQIGISQSIYNNATEGTNFGQFTATSKAAFQTAIATANGVYNNPSATVSEITTATTNLATASKNFSASQNNFVSTEANPKWFYIRNYAYPTRRISSNTNADGAIITCPENSTTDKELWRFESTGTSYKIISKAASTKGIQEKGKSTRAQLQPIASATEMIVAPSATVPGAFTIQKLGGSTFNFLHSASDLAYDIVGWQTTGSDASIWYLEAYEASANTDGAWETPATWNTGAVPTPSTTNVIINAATTLNSDITAPKLTINAGKSLTVAADKQLTVSGSITLLSGTDGTATVTGNVGGTATVHQAIDKYRSWYMSLPVNNVSGNTGVGSYSTFAESTDTWTVGSALSGVSAGTGVAINPTNNSVTSLSFTGTLNNGDVSLTGLSSGNKRWHYVGNPYPSYLAWSGLSKTNLEETVWFRTAVGNTYKYATWNGMVGAPSGLISDGTIAPLQGFWVQVKSGQTGTLSFTNAMRSHYSTGNKLLRAPQASEMSLLRLTVSNGSLSDEAVVYFKEGNLNGKDRFDAAKIMNGNNVPEIYTLLNGEATVINAMESVPYGVELPLGFNTKVAGNFTISASEFSHFAADDRVLLLDKSNNSLTDLSLGAYSFESGATTTNDRFAIKLVPGSATGIDKTTDGAYIFANNNRQLVVSLAGANEGASIRIYTVAGQQIAAQALTTRVTTLRAPLNNGAYVVEIINGGKQSVQRVIVK